MVMLAQGMRRPHLAIGVQLGQWLHLGREQGARGAPAWAGFAAPTGHSWVVTAEGCVGSPVMAGRKHRNKPGLWSNWSIYKEMRAQFWAQALLQHLWGRVGGETWGRAAGAVRAGGVPGTSTHSGGGGRL